MKRQIKFRGKRLDNGEWVYGHYVDYMYPDCGLPSPSIIYILPDIGNMIVAVDPSTVGQFTGLTDKNGTEIYEGDMLECPQVPNVPLEVYYNTSKGAFCLAEHTHIEGVLKGTTPIGDMLDYYPDMIIIGNIHNNPIEE